VQTCSSLSPALAIRRRRRIHGQLRGHGDDGRSSNQAGSLLFQMLNPGRTGIIAFLIRRCMLRGCYKIVCDGGDRERIFGLLRGSENGAVNLILLYFVTQYTFADFEQPRRLTAAAARFSEGLTDQVFFVGFD